MREGKKRITASMSTNTDASKLTTAPIVQASMSSRTATSKVPAAPSDDANFAALSLEDKMTLMLKFNCDVIQCFRQVELNLNTKLDGVQSTLNDIAEVKADVAAIKTEELPPMKQDISNNSTEINNIKAYLKKDANDRRVQRIKDGIKAREHNLIIGNIPENGKWESREQAYISVRKFLDELFSFEKVADETNWVDPRQIVIEDAHRLPSNPLTFNPNKIVGLKRSLIIRCQTVLDRNIILKRCKYLKNYNLGKNGYNVVYIKRHYPAEIQDQERELRPTFNKMRKEGKKPRFEIDYESATVKIVEFKPKATIPAPSNGVVIY